MYGFERVAEIGVAGWLAFNMLGMALVAVGVARQYARAAVTRRDEQTAEVAFDPILTLTE
ncbi:MAG: hypothetical protein WBW84_15010 [Acidobacteriaceae bacterium]